MKHKNFILWLSPWAVVIGYYAFGILIYLLSQAIK